MYLDKEANLVQAKEALKKYFGYDYFREGQEELISSILNGDDVLGILPTSAGKSIIYQIPALCFEGITLVISPLISLMKDQVYSLNQAGIHAAYINSSLTTRQNSLAIKRASEGQYKIIYVAPERLETNEFIDFAMGAQISMVAVDEAHCISQWGQDFRPSYLKITNFIEKLSLRPIVSAFTATATKEVIEDISFVLKQHKPKVLIAGFDRKNLYYEVQMPKDKEAWVLDYIERHSEESGIVYCSTRKNVDELCAVLNQRGLLATRYHAGLGDQERRANQEDFIYDIKPIMVATNAFGMGIDKSNVRYVIHYNMPKNMEGYYQEAGRAGRDGEPSECILLYAPKDVAVNQFLIEKGNENDELPEDAAELIRERDAERLKKMTYFCFTKDCLREYILKYFGEKTVDCCDNCFNCNTQFEEIDITEISKEIIACIMQCNGRYGINVIVGTLRGMKQAKLKGYGMFSNKQYGKLSDISDVRLKQIINKLLLEEYLFQTNDKYGLLRVNQTGRDLLVDGTTTIIMKLAKEDILATKERTDKNTKKKRRTESLNSKGFQLFEDLRALRMQLAKKEGMPPYIIFSDKTLVDMCIKLPFSKEEMLAVSGVGENKYQKYGEEFLEVIVNFTAGEKEQYYRDDGLGIH